MRTWVVINDVQIPFQDKPVLDLVLAFIKDLKPDGIILNGDIADCYSISSHRHNPRTLTKASLEVEIRQVGELLAHFKDIPEKHFLGGNHEDRFYRHIADKAPALGLIPGLDFQTIFGLGEYGFNWKDYGGSINLGRLSVTHGFLVRTQSAYSAKAHFERTGSSLLIGHTHRFGSYFKTNSGGTHVVYENGCLCRLDPEYVQHPDWQQGFSVVHVDKSGFFHVQHIPIIGRRVFYYGKDRWERKGKA
jgi:UDP-2,3-diacylglucosamine pyrophosphatase LpxH